MRQLAILLLGAILILGGLELPAQTDADRILAIVNGSVITSRQVDDSVKAEIDVLIRQARDRADLERRAEQLQSEKLNELIERQLILFDFKDSGYQLPEPIVDGVITDRIKQRYATRETFIATLQHEGKTYETFRQEQRDQIIIEALRQKNVSIDKVLISPQRIQRYYDEHRDKYKREDQVKLRMIVLNVTSANPLEEIRKLGAEIIAKINQGAPFAEMASIYSEGFTRAQGGDRGWVERASLRKELADVAFSLKLHEHSALVEIPGACYILMVDELQPAHVTPLADAAVRDEIETTLKAQERNRLQKKWMDRIKKKAYVRLF